MANILILGAGVMGSALCVPATDNGHQVTLVGTHLDTAIIDSLKATHYHPTLDVQLPESVIPKHHTEVKPADLESADAVILGISSAGVDWAVQQLKSHNIGIKLMAVVTKGLEGNGNRAAQTYAHTLANSLHPLLPSAANLVFIGGPCIARELSLRVPTSVVYAAIDEAVVDEFRSNMQTHYYRVHTSNDSIGVEACAALKNFMAIGVSATLEGWPVTRAEITSSAKNPCAAAFTQAVRELIVLCQWLGGQAATAVDLAGMGDLHVTVGGGRNSRLGMQLGKGLTVSAALSGPLKGETVEGRDTGLALSAGLHKALADGVFQPDQLPLTLAILHAIEEDKPFVFDFSTLGESIRENQLGRISEGE